jgi:Uma2 family endonuclease
MITRVSTAEQLARMPGDGNRYELVQGVLNMMSPAGGRHGRVTVRINRLLAIHVDDPLAKGKVAERRHVAASG